MTITTNIFIPGLSGANTSAQSPGNAGGTMTLLDFVNLLAGNAAATPAPGAAPLLPAKLAALQQNPPATVQNDPLAALLQLIQSVQQGAAAQPQAGSSAPAQAAASTPLLLPQPLQTQQAIQVLQGETDATVPAPDLSIPGPAALLPQPVGTQQPLPPPVPADLIRQIVALLQSAAPPQVPTAIQPALTSDLSSQSAPVVQDQAAGGVADRQIRDLLALLEKTEHPDDKLAALLDAIAPQGGAATPPVIDVSLLVQLQAKMSAPSAHFTRDDAVQFLKDKGFDLPTVQRYMTVLDKITAAQTAAASKPETTDVPLPQQADQSAPAVQLQQSGQEQTKLEVQRHPLQIAQTNDQQAGQQKAQQQPQPQPAQQQAQPQPKADTPQHISFINSLAREADQDTSGFGGGEQSGSQLFGQSAGQQAANLMSAPAAANASGFINYMSAAGGSDAPAPTTQMVAVQLQANALARTDIMTLQLEPANLGRLDIRLKFDRDGGIRAHLSADRPETLAMLRQDSTHLQRALQQAGFDTDDTTLSFDLRQQSQQQNAGDAQDNPQGQGKNSPYPNASTDGAALLQAQLSVQAYGYISQSHVNIMV